MARIISASIALALVPALQPMLAQGKPDRFAEPVTITDAQVNLLVTEARALGQRIADTRNRIQSLEADRAVNAQWNVLSERVQAELKQLPTTQAEFVRRSSNTTQGQAAEVFFDDLGRQYNDVVTTLKTFNAAQYPRARDRTFGALEHQQLAYQTVGAQRSETFNLDVKSSPVGGGAVSFHRKGDPFKPHPDPTATTVKNLVYAVWTVRVTLSGQTVPDQDHDPLRDSNHSLLFTFPHP